MTALWQVRYPGIRTYQARISVNPAIPTRTVGHAKDLLEEVHANHLSEEVHTKNLLEKVHANAQEL